LKNRRHSLSKFLTEYILFFLLCGGAAAQDIYQKENLGPNVNSKYEELLPVISPDGKSLFFVRNQHPENIEFVEGGDNQDIWFSELMADGSWSPAKNIGTPLNTPGHNFVSSAMPDGNTLLIGNAYNEDGSLFAGVSLTHRIPAGWSFPRKVNIENYYNYSQFVTFFMSNSGKIILMTVNRSDSYGGEDVYVSFLRNDTLWSEPMNLGSGINTEGDEISPYLAADEVTLYYATDGKGGFGSADVFVTRRLDDTWKNWSVPENLGPAINSTGWDAYYYIPASGEYVYFVSWGDEGSNSDIYRIKLPEKVKPNPVTLISGKVMNSKTNLPIEAKIYYELLPEGLESGIARSHHETGEYKITLPSGKKYGFRAEADGFVSVNDYIDVSDINSYNEITRDLYLVPIEIGQIIKLNNIFFDFNKYTLKDESFPELNRVVKFLNENPKITIEIDGHTDNVGSDQYNQTLSENRAKSVYEYLIKNNISESRLSYKGFGESNPVATNKTDEGRQLNRRVEFVILSK
jgi:outer membrane protein OmpA-like peptidoglycan-associated protein